MNTGVIWFRNALRLNDNRVLVECLNSTNSQTILPLHILNKSDLEQNNNENRIKFLYESLIDLDANFKNKFGSNLIVLNGKSEEVFRKLLNSELLDISEIFTDYSNNTSASCLPKKSLSVADLKKISYDLNNSLMLVTALAPKIGYDNAAKIAKAALKNKTTLKFEATKTGLISAKDFDEIVDPKKMTYPG